MSLIMGEHSYGEPRIMGGMNTVTIGKFCSIAGNVTFDGGFQHNINIVTTYPFNQKWQTPIPINSHPVCKGDIIVGNDVWLAEGCTIMSGVTIGDGAVIGGHALVTKDVEPYSVVGGIPAKHIKYKIPLKHVNFMLNLKWWDWSNELIYEMTPWLMGDIESFINKCYEKNLVK